MKIGRRGKLEDKDFLLERHMNTVLGLTSGVPQGPILAPTVYHFHQSFGVNCQVAI